MSNFFTPIEVLSEGLHPGDQYEVDKYHNDPFKPSSAKIESIDDNRRKIMQWLKNMPPNVRTDKLTYTNKEFACLLMAMHERVDQAHHAYLSEFGISYHPQRGFRIVEEKHFHRASPLLLEAQEKLLQSVLIANRYSRFDSVAIDAALSADVNSLFELFDVIENGVSHELTFNNYDMCSKDENSYLLFCNPQEQDGSVVQSLAGWVVEVIKKNLSLHYFRDCLEAKDKQKKAVGNTANGCQMLEIFKNKSKQFRRFWKSISKADKESLILKVLEENPSEILSQYRQIIKVSSDSFPRIRYSTEPEIEMFIDDLIKEQGENLLSQLLYCRLCESGFEIATYKYELMIQIETQIERKKRDEAAAMKKKAGRPHKLSKLYSGQFQKVDLIPDQKIIKKNMDCNDVKENSKTKSQSVSKQIKQSISKDVKKLDYSFEGGKQMSETTNDQEQQKISVCEKINKSFEIDTAKQEQFNKVLKQFNDRISGWNKFQQLALNRVGAMLNTYNLSFQLFGSFATGLAISSSDIDISVDPGIIHFFYGSFCSYKQKIIQALQFLQGIFRQVSWAGNFNLITTASVPVLQFEIDLSIHFGLAKNQDFNITKKKGPKISVDISIQPFVNMTSEVVPHLGLDSTALVKQWTLEYSNLSSVLRVLKYLLNRSNLNKSFTGGLSSFALTNMLYCFIKAKDKAQSSYLSLILDFCEFFCSLPETDVIFEAAAAEPIRQAKTTKLTVISPLNGRNLTENCYKIEEIKQLFTNVKREIEAQAQNTKQFAKRIRNLLVL